MWVFLSKLIGTYYPLVKLCLCCALHKQGDRKCCEVANTLHASAGPSTIVLNEIRRELVIHQ